MKRGRPAISTEAPPRKFEKTLKYPDGTSAVWKYNLDKFENGPIEVEFFYPANYKPEFEIAEEQEKVNSKIPLKYRTFFNPKNGKKVAYQRAKQLGLI